MWFYLRAFLISKNTMLQAIVFLRNYYNILSYSQPLTNTGHCQVHILGELYTCVYYLPSYSLYWCLYHLQMQVLKHWEEGKEQFQQWYVHNT